MDINILLVTAISIGFIHTIIGPDHYLPFILLGRARKWGLRRTAFVTFLCGVGHVLSSVVLGLVGVILGLAVGVLEQAESARGEWASWLLVGFGVAYAVWGLRLGFRAGEHAHDHDHPEERHTHVHHHLGRHIHVHGNVHSATPWALFVIFILGPCEPLIPILMYPAAQGSWWGLLWVTAAFGVTTISTMIAVVMVTSSGLLKIDLGFMERYVHALAGIIIAISGLSINVFGL